MSRRLRLLLGAGLTISGLVFAAGSNEFDAALADAVARGKTPPGSDYMGKSLDVLSRYVTSAMDACGPKFPDMNQPSYVVLVIGADGKVSRKMAEPGSAFSQCITSHFPSGMSLPHPPGDAWPIVVGLQNRYHAQANGAGAPASRAALTAYEEAIAPYVEKGRASYPGAKERFLKGLPTGSKFMVRIRLMQRPNKVEEVFLEVTAIQDGTVTGTLNRVDTLTNYHRGQRISVPESEIKDWLIQRPDGSEEGNVVGNYLRQHKA